MSISFINKWHGLGENFKLLALRRFGPLAHLVGIWKGTGYAIISRPDAMNNQIFNFQQNSTIEEIAFIPLIASILNRSSTDGEGDITLKGLLYEQAILDADNIANVLHFEIGQWILVPDQKEPLNPDKVSVVRQANILHGASFVAMGSAPSLIPELGRPNIGELDLDTTPTGPPVDQDRETYLQPIETAALPPGIPDGSKRNPAVFLTHQLQTQKVIDYVKFDLTARIPKTASVDRRLGILNIPFLDDNAQVTELTSTFYVEHLEDANEPTQSSMQLQYAQRVILNFRGVDWPHVSVGTLQRHDL